MARPRIANRILKRVRDFAQVTAGDHVTLAVAREALDRLEIDQLGLDENDRRVLRAIVELFNGGPVGLSTLAAATAEEVDAVEDVYEPFLIQLGMLQRTPRGRIATRRAYEHLGVPYFDRPAPIPIDEIQNDAAVSRILDLSQRRWSHGSAERAPAVR